MKYKVNIGKYSKFYGLNSDEYEEGEYVEFKVPFVSDATTKVTSDDVVLKSKSGDTDGYVYGFIMPGKDVEINISVTEDMLYRGDATMGMMGPGMMMNMFEAQNNMSKGTENVSSGTGKGKFCRDCGAKLDKEGQQFCQECGAKQF